MNWIIIDSADKIYEAEDLSQNEKVLIFKYSHNCIVSYSMKFLLNREWNQGEMNMKTYLVNVIENRDLSNDIAERYGVKHEQPQMLILYKGKCIHSVSHGKAQFANIREFKN